MNIRLRQTVALDHLDFAAGHRGMIDAHGAFVGDDHDVICDMSSMDANRFSTSMDSNLPRSLQPRRHFGDASCS